MLQAIGARVPSFRGILGHLHARVNLPKLSRKATHVMAAGGMIVMGP